MGQYKNLLIEWQESHQEEIEEKFLEENQQAFQFFKSHTHYRTEEEIVAWFIEENQGEFDSLAIEMFESEMQSKADYDYDAYKDSLAGL